MTITLNEQALIAAKAAFYADEGNNDSGIRAAVTAYLAATKAAELETYALEITRVLTGLAGGGSELFEGQIGEFFKADLVRCAAKIRDRHAKIHALLVAEKRETRRLSAVSDARPAIESALTKETTA